MAGKAEPQDKNSNFQVRHGTEQAVRQRPRI